ncbi:hypothetical protein [Nocardia brasiliensis]|uniref:hypothetical protein n=1 Tax=Nocardia brasiliensis TaxID=37326 RepID=UPI001894A013|nr:hypothetical protein [Nocardia brasiliensis]MBF6125897.1 hypothetical protein [Nocardia brasiliensis]
MRGAVGAVVVVGDEDWGAGVVGAGAVVWLGGAAVVGAGLGADGWALLGGVGAVVDVGGGLVVGSAAAGCVPATSRNVSPVTATHTKPRRIARDR